MRCAPGQGRLLTALKLGLAGFCVIWFGVIVPGHVRGQISWARGEACHLTLGSGSADAAEGCCATDGTPSPEERKQCAVCYYVLGLSVPPVLAFDVAPAGRVMQHAMAWSEQVRRACNLDPIRSRGPPAARPA